MNEPTSPIQATDSLDLQPSSASDPSIQAAVNELESGAPAPAAPDPQAAPEAPQATDVDPIRLAKAARRAERIASEERRKRAELERVSEEKVKAAEAKAAELEALLSGVRSRDGLDALMKRTGLDFNALSRAYLGIDPEAPSPEAKTAAEIAELKRWKEEREQRESEERQQIQQERERIAYQRDLQGVAAFVQSKADMFELVSANADRGAIAEVVKRANAALKAHPDVTIKTEQERIELVTFFCQQVEDDLFAQAKDAHQRLSQIKKLQSQGISTHTSSDIPATTTESSPEAQALAAIKDTLGAKTSTKFLTNASTLSAPPSKVPSARTFIVRNEHDAEFERLINELQR